MEEIGKMDKMDTKELISALKMLEKEKGIDREYMFQAIESALVIAYKKSMTGMKGADLVVNINRENADVVVYKHCPVVENGLGQDGEYDLDEAKELNPEYEIGDVVVEEIDPAPFSRIAAQTAKQVVLQKLREAESGKLYTEFRKKENTVTTGIVRRVEKKNIIVDIGNFEAVIPPSEQIEGEKIEAGDKIKLYVAKVNKTNYGPEIIVSRSNSGIVGRLFETEVPEIEDGTVVIKAISREPGSRTKIAVWSENPNIDPVGSCVGHKGTRVQAVVDALGGEKVDIIKWSEDPAEFIAAALSPAKVISMEIDAEEKLCKVLVPAFQLSLAIGKEGQNARLAAKLTGWKIDIKPEENVSLEF